MSRYIETGELENWFGYHPPSTPEIAAGHDTIRAEANAAIACKQDIGQKPWVVRPVSITVTPIAEAANLPADGEEGKETPDADPV